MCSCVNLNVHAQEPYTTSLDEDNTYIWEVKELDLHNFKKVFGFEPAFEVGDQIKKVIKEINNLEAQWTLTVIEWDYKSDFSVNGTIRYYSIEKNPTLFDGDVFIPTPAEEYLAEAAATKGSEYQAEGFVFTKKDKGVDGSNIKMSKEYDIKGVLITETYTDEDAESRVIVKVEGTWKIIPMGNYYIGFIAMAMVMAIIITSRKINRTIKQ